MVPDAYSGAQQGASGSGIRSSNRSSTGQPRRSSAAASRSGLLSFVVLTVLPALDAGSSLRAADSTAPTASSTTSQPAHPVASEPRAPIVVDWLNQTLRLRDTVQALDRPFSDGKALARIRAGAEVKAIGIIAGEQWVQVELPDQGIAYIPREAVELNDSVAARSTGQGSATGTPGAASPNSTAAPEIIRGPVTKVPNAGTLVVADHRIRLSGIDPGPSTVLSPFENWIRAQGALMCEPDAQTGRYRCFTDSGIDVAEAAILNGAGRVGDGATPGYRERETEARQGRRGLWQGS
jgi:endonuclease YncB( thermonuclease family)